MPTLASFEVADLPIGSEVRVLLHNGRVKTFQRFTPAWWITVEGDHMRLSHKVILDLARRGKVGQP